MAEKQDIQSELQEFIKMNLRAMRTDKTLVDVILVCNDQKFGVHKVLLAASCNFFYDLFTKSDAKNGDELELNGIHPRVLTLILDFIYSGTCEVPVRDQILLEVLFQTANELKFDLLVNFCTEVVFKESDNPVPCLMKIADKFKMEVLYSLVYSKAETVYAEDLNSDKYLEIPQAIFVALMSKLDLNVDMDDRMKKILGWVQHDKNRVENFPKLLDTVNFHALSEECLLQLPSNPVIMTDMPLMMRVMKEISGRLQAAKSASASILSSRSNSPFHFVNSKNNDLASRAAELVHAKEETKSCAASSSTPQLPHREPKSVGPSQQQLKPIDPAPPSVKQSSVPNLPFHPERPIPLNGPQTSLLGEPPISVQSMKISVSRLNGYADQQDLPRFSLPAQNRNEQQENRGYHRNNKSAFREGSNKQNYNAPPLPHLMASSADRNVQSKRDPLPQEYNPVMNIIESRSKQFENKYSRGPPGYNNNAQMGGAGNRRNDYERNAPRGAGVFVDNRSNNPEKPKAEFSSKPLVNDDKPVTLVAITPIKEDEQNFLQVFSIGGLNGPVLKHSEALNDFLDMFTLAACDDYIYFVGGRAANWEVCNDNKEYDVRTKQWRKRKGMNFPRFHSGSAFFQAHLYVIGGIGQSNTRQDKVERYDRQTDTWKVMASTAYKHEIPSVFADKDRLIVLGGYTVEQEQYKKRQLKPQMVAICEIYDPRINQWTEIETELPIGRQIDEMCYRTLCLTNVGRTFSINKSVSKMPSPSGDNQFHFLYEASKDMTAWKRRTFQADLMNIVAIGLCNGMVYILDSAGQLAVYSAEKVKTEKVERIEKLSSIGYAVFM